MHLIFCIKYQLSTIFNVYKQFFSKLHNNRNFFFRFNKTYIYNMFFSGNIGGSLGLFLGASIISVFELIYFFVVRLYVDRWNKNKVKKDVKKTRKFPLIYSKFRV